jgi:hypothetical protein
VHYYCLVPNDRGGHRLVGPHTPGGSLVYFHPQPYRSAKEIRNWCVANGFHTPTIYNNLRKEDRTTADMGMLLRFRSTQEALLFKLSFSQ